MKPILYWKKSKAEEQLVAGFQSSVCLRKIQRNSAIGAITCFQPWDCNEMTRILSRHMYRCAGGWPTLCHFTPRRSGGHHGEGSDAQQQRKEEAEAGQEQEERRSQPGQTRHLVHEPIRQEALASDHGARPQRAPLSECPLFLAAFLTRVLHPNLSLSCRDRDLARRTFGICCLYESCPA